MLASPHLQRRLCVGLVEVRLSVGHKSLLFAHGIISRLARFASLYAQPPSGVVVLGDVLPLAVVGFHPV